jgi:sphinganine-1-phosphate aldolase
MDPTEPKETVMSEPSFAAGLFGDMYPYSKRFPVCTGLPEKGRDPEEIYQELAAMSGEEDRKWESGQVSGTMYHGGRQHYAFLNRAFGLFSYVNLLQRDLCPSGTKIEGEIVAMTAKLLGGEAARRANPQDEVCGVVTSGGSESIYNGVYVHREWAREEKGITQPELVAPATIHPAFDKAAHYLGVKISHVPVGQDYEADVEAMRRAITPNTIMVCGSAANYPYGVIDPLARLSAMALEHRVGLHVDGCLGGFILPWVERLGYKVPPFDFRLPGVTSLSCDTHKYAYGLKGTSVLLLRNPRLRRYMFFSKADWPGGVYASPTVQGSRSGGLSAATWASMMSMGESGYLEAARCIMSAADTIRAGIAKIPELKIMGKSTFLIAVTSEVVDIYQVNDYLSGKGWRMNGCQNPPGFHFCITLPQTLPGVAERFVEDLRAGVAYARNPPQAEPASGAIYGLSASADGRQIMHEGMVAWLEATYEAQS